MMKFHFKMAQICRKTFMGVKSDFWPKSRICGNDATVDKLDM